MSKKFESVQQAEEYLSKVENSLKEIEDLMFNVNADIDKSKAEIKSLEQLGQSIKEQNYELWSNQVVKQQEIEEVQMNEPTIDDIIKGVDLN